MSKFEDGLERGIFASRWLLAPMYVGLLAGLLLVTVKFFAALWKMVSTYTFAKSAEDVTVEILTLIDIALLGNLILIVIFAGYENFVSKIKVAEDSEDRPSWMGTVDFSGLKMKLIGSLVAISVILLLKDFVDADGKEMDYEAVAWRIGLHFTFVISGVLFAVMDYWGAKRSALLTQTKVAAMQLKSGAVVTDDSEVASTESR
ncbi:TIGR00645 family protein [Demequina sp. B12]|uniref:TIGR00645 family protein n=1 Tax=Demequina sp. B12 TaxID=2992757 RepID=UPI00237A0DA3|nr:TIGR00645 family protein [Demequina sp. B12]MDE0573439.1 TIGR00645 family protein [Demequina sp. B12]